MDTSRIKKFASEARTILKRGVAAKILSLGFDANGHIDESEMPVLIQGGTIFRGQRYSANFYHQWMSLYKRIQESGIKEVYEEAAYTWFNRFLAIRILQKNGLTEPILTFVDVARTPQIVDAARMGHFPQMSAADEEKLRTLLGDATAVTQQFSLLITAYCHNNPIIYKCFGSIADYTELLLPNDILAENGFIDKLNHTEFITNEDFSSPELIGWLYQFYISERKDEVFAKKGKFDAEEIPAATQIFTPNWIVKYMVQNTVGRIYLDNNPWATELKDKWKYLVEPSEPIPEEAKLKYKDLTELRVGDLACGSGHILNECFDLLFDLYIEDGYSRSEAIESIFKYNLTGIDIDTRAKQLAIFALLLKACQRDHSFADAHCMPNILNMPVPQNDEEVLSATLHNFFKGGESRHDTTALLDAFKLMQDAGSLGSIMIFDIPDSTRSLIKQTVEYYDAHPEQQEAFTEILPAMKLILALTEKYHALVMNPPYMGSGNMNDILKNYVNSNYEEGKADLFSVFMLLAMNRLCKKGKYGMINMHSWMFLTSFEKLRKSLLNTYCIESLLHLGARTFDELSGEVVQNAAFIVQNFSSEDKSSGDYFRLIEGKNCANKEALFLAAQSGHYHKIRYSKVRQQNFDSIPGYSLGYWVNEKTIEIFKNSPSLHSISKARLGQNTGDNDRFLRYWFEITYEKIGFNLPDSYNGYGYKWIPYTKGGLLRRWFGPSESVVNWANDGEEVKNYCVIRNNGKHWSRYIQSYDCFYKSGLVFPRIGTGNFCTRFIEKGTIFDVNAPGCFPDSNQHFLLGYLNSNVIQYFLSILCPTLTFQVGDVSKVPCIGMTENHPNISILVQKNVDISKEDWNIHESSSKFQKNELLLMAFESDSIEHCYNMYCEKWADKFYELHRNEEELNRQFIEIYGLQDELTPEVPLDEITILQQREISIENGELKWHPDVIIKQLISYAVGCWMGRYRLDKPGLHIAHPNPTDEEICAYTYNGSKLTIDDDGIIPILSADSTFDDNLVKRVQDFIRIAFGTENVNQNINFVEACLGTSLEKYLQKDFWKDHKKMYQNRPIYWLFSSNKGAFQCLAYMHRMDANAADKVRSCYLMKHMDYLRQSIAGLEANAAALNTSERNQLKKLRNDLGDCEEYNNRLQLIADKRIAFDLDDGVVVNYAKFGDVLAKIK